MSKDILSKIKMASTSSASSSSSSASTQHLIDSLTSHISLYHSSLSSSCNLSPHPRSSILKWFSSLTPHQRQSTLTIISRSFINLLLSMLKELNFKGNGHFLVLPDMPSDENPLIPSLCFRKIKGLLARVSEKSDSERMIRESVRLFESREGERVEESAGSVERLDSLVLCEELVSNVDRFVEVMDELSNYGFLRGDVTGLAGPSADWIELGWLKDRGYYSLEAFVANRVEVALRIAWLDRKKKRGKVGKMDVSGIAANVYWRKKGCVDWWGNLDGEIKRKLLTSVLGKTAKTMISEVLKSENSGSLDETLLPFAGVWYESKKLRLKPCGRTFPEVAFVRSSSSITSINYSGKCAALTNICKGLSVLQDIYNILLAYQCGECDRETLFFTTLYSVHTSMDFMFRKLRGFLMTISLECTKVELLEGGIFDSPSVSCKEKKVSANRRKKGRNRNGKRQDTVQAPDVVHPPNEQIKDCRLADPESLDVDESNKMGVKVQEKDLHCKTPLSTAEKHAEEVANGKVRTAARKKRKERRKNKRSRLCDPAEEGNLEATTAKTSPSSAVICKAVKPNCSSEISVVHNSDSIDHSCPVPESVQFSNMVEGQAATSSSDNSIEDYCSGNNSFENSGHLGEKRANAGFEVLESREETIFNEDRELRNFSDSGPTSSSASSSYEWPSVSPVPFSIINSNLPAATDRLHLDVGSNWHNHFHQSFMPAVRQARSPAVQSGRNCIQSRPLPMSLDWPPVVRGFSNLVPPVACNYDSRFISRRQTSFQPALASHSVQIHAPTIEDEKKHDGDMTEKTDIINALETADECDSRGISEEELELHGVSGMDYNQFFGGGVMYWNPSDHAGKGFSRPPSLSSDDSSWAWHESEMRRTIDDMVAFSSSYSTNGLTSPTAASFCSPFEPLGPGHQALGYVVQGNEVTGKVIHSSSTMTDVVAEEGVSRSMINLNGDVDRSSGDALPYPLLRPIIIPNMSNERSRSEFRGHDHKSPCFPPSRREQPRIKRPPSPVVLCVPRAPRPPPPSPVSDSRKHKGFPTVRSGSSSPKNWGLRGMYYDGTNAEESCVSLDGPEAFWPSWRSNNFSAHPIIQPLPGALLQDRLLAMSQLAREQEHPDVAFPLQPPELVNSSTQKACLSLMQKLLHDEIDSFCRKVASEKMVMKPYINWAVKRVTRSLQVLWPRSRTNIFGSNATGLSLPSSDVDLVVCLPPVRNLEPIKEAGILEGRNGIKETCLQHAARYLVNQEWVKNDSLKTVENTAIPIIMLVVEVPSDLVTTVTSSVQTPKVESTLCNDLDHSHLDIVDIENTALASHKFSKLNFENKALKSVRLDISFKSPSHTGLQTTELVKQITERFPAVTPLALVLKQFLADRSLDQSYSGGLSSYCLVLIITRFLQHEHHLGRPIYQNFGSLLMDFLYFFGNVFDPRQMRISVQGSGVYIKRERGHSIDPIHIDDPLCPTNNVGRNCFRIHQCIKAFSDAHFALENELNDLSKNGDSGPSSSYKLLPKIIPSIDLFVDGKHSKES